MIKACPCITVLKAFTRFGIDALKHAFKKKKSTFPSCFQDAKYPSKYAHRFPVRLLVFSFILGSGAARARHFMSKSNFSSFTHNDCKSERFRLQLGTAAHTKGTTVSELC